MTNLKKTVYIGQIEEIGDYGIPRYFPVFSTIKLSTDGKLSITGVVGPKLNGDALCCGQSIVNPAEIVEYAESWSADLHAKFNSVWNEWHLNGMKPYTVEMRQKGWHKLAKKEIYKHFYILTNETSDEISKIKKDGERRLQQGQTVARTCDEIDLVNLSYFIEGYSYEKDSEAAKGEIFNRKGVDASLYQLRSPKPAERKTLGLVTPSEHSDGLLGRELNGKGYGSNWYFHEIPQDVVEFLLSLPVAEKQLPGRWKD